MELVVDGGLNERIRQVLRITLGKSLIAVEAKIKVNEDSNEKNKQVLAIISIIRTSHYCDHSSISLLP